MITLSDSYNTRFNVPKPDFPYTVGKHLRVRSHIPPQPTNLSNCLLKFHARRERESIDPVQRCLLHPPSSGTFTSGVAELEIIKLVRAGDQHGAQLLTVRVLTSTYDLPSDTDLLAKFYDPLYFDHEQDDADPFLCVDSAYTHESAVYQKLADFQGSIIPKYYGSFSLSLPIDHMNSREVRLILMENVPGISMHDLNPSNFTKSERQAIMKAIIDSETALYNHEVRHRDIYPRNILVLPSDHARKVVLVDFGKAWTSRSPFPEWEEKFLPGIPISPLLRWIKPREWFDGWVDWDWMAWVEQHYEHTRGSITEYMQRKWGPKDLSTDKKG
jgi:serine/threonine protein kinase